MEAPPELQPIVRRLLWADVVAEVVIAFLLSGILGSPHEWLDVSALATYVATGVFLVGGAAIAVAAWRPSTSRDFVQQLGLANVIGGAAVWTIGLVFWGRFSVEGRTLVAAIGDTLILIGILELVALWRTNPNRNPDP